MKRPVFLFFFFSLLQTITAQLLPEPIQIPMRDGKNLSAHLYRPNQQGSFPVILIQTPYNKNLLQLGLPLGVGQNIAGSSYAFVVLDWRCFYGSLLACTANPDRGKDGYDAVEWIAAQPWCNGKVGAWGPSALGNIQFQTAREHPPHLVCAVPMVASPQVHYQQYYPGGSARTEYLETLGILFGGLFSLIPQSPHYNLVWQVAENASMYPEEIEIPMLLIGGWFDHNTDDNLLMFDTLRALSPVSAGHRLLMGPWTHGGTGPSFVGSAQQGELSFPEAANWHNAVANDFFAYYLLGENNGWENSPAILYFQMGGNTWEEVSSFPPDGLSTKIYYLLDGGILHPVPSFAQPTSVSFTYDPNDPSPTTGGKTLNTGLLQGPYDQRDAVESRNDVLVFTTDILENDLVVNGKIRVFIHVASDRKDTDFALRLTDVYPDGRSILLGETIQRMRFREGYRVSDTAFMQPGVVYPIELSFDHLAQTFKAGHRLRLIISSSNYPRYNRNMNTGGDMYPGGNLDTLVNPLLATNAVFIHANYPSRIELPVRDSGVAVDDKSWEKDIRVFPNPAVHSVVLENLPIPSQVQLADAQGHSLLLLKTSESKAVLDTAGLPFGTYFLTIENISGQSTARKIVLGL